MKHFKSKSLIAICLFAMFVSCAKDTAVGMRDDVAVLSNEPEIGIPVSNNSYVTKAAPTRDESISDQGLVNWKNSGSIISTYFRIGTSGNLTLKLKAKVRSGNSVVRVTVKGKSFDLRLSGNLQKEYPVGTVQIDEIGYVKVDLQGLTKTGTTFADVSQLIVSGSATAKDLVFAKDINKKNYDRRGVALTLYFDTPPKTEWFYNEITVAPGEDPTTSFYMANGFKKGYFGMQVRDKDRTFQYSIWENNNVMPILLEKHKDVTHTGFNHEGSGGATTLIYPWVSGTTYKFLTRSIFDGFGGTLFSSWVYLPEKGSWHFIATFRLPGYDEAFGGLHCFIENWDENQGHLFRKATYSNQWARDASGVWIELNKAHSAGGQAIRKDYASGVTEKGDFYAQISGFFSENIPNGSLVRPLKGVPPSVDLENLPNVNVDKYLKK